MKRRLAVALAVASCLGALTAQAIGQNTYPPVYDATAARLTAVAPQPPRRTLPLVYDATGAMRAAQGSPAPTLLGQDGALQGIAGYIQAHEAVIGSTPPLVYDATAAMQAAQGSPAPTLLGQDGALQGIAGYIQAHEAVNGGTLPLVYDATGAMQVAVVQSGAADAAVVATPAVAAAHTAPSTYLVIGLGLLAAAVLMGAWTLAHRPAAQGHRPRHV